MLTTGQRHYLSQKVVFTHINTSKSMEILNRGDNVLMADVMWRLVWDARGSVTANQARWPQRRDAAAGWKTPTVH